MRDGEFCRLVPSARKRHGSCCAEVRSGIPQRRRGRRCGSLEQSQPPRRRQATPDQTLLRPRAGRYGRWRRPPLRTRKSCVTGLTTRSCGSSGRCRDRGKGPPCLRRLEFFVGERLIEISLNDHAWHGCLLRSSNIHYQGRSWKAPWESTTQRNSISSGPVHLGGCGRHPRRRRHRRPQRPRGPVPLAR